MTVWKRFFFLTLAGFLCFLPFPSVAKERPVSVNFWPLFHYTYDPVEEVSEFEGLGPIFYWRKDLDRKQWGIRPLLYWTRDENEPLRRLEFVYPFGKYEVKEKYKKGYLFPISNYREQEFDGKKKWHFEFFPFFIGKTEEGQDYGGLFPFFGTLLKRYGKDEIHFYLWPLYSESTTEDVRTKNFLWPFFSFTEGEKKSGYRFWPIYGKREEFGVSKKEFLLWPIFVRRTRGLDTEDPTFERMIFPFFISKESKNFKAKTYLWPLFSHAREQTTGFEQWDLPWPFFRTFKGEDLYGVRFFILYGYKERGESKRIYVLYPLFRYEEDWIKDVQERTYRILLARIRIGEDDQGLETERSLRIWPFFDYEKEETGRETFSLFYLFPFKDEGFERNLFPLFRIWRWEKSRSGNISANLFWGFYRKMRKGELVTWEVAHLIGFKKGPGWKTVSLLKGLLLYKREGEAACLRLFYLPFYLRWSHQKEGGFESYPKEFADGRQKDWNIRNGFISSGEGPFQF